MGVFADFLTEKKILDVQILGVSNEREHLRDEDRKILFARRQARKNDKKYAEVDAANTKPRSGRGVSQQALSKARADQPISRKSRGKVLASVNSILTNRKQSTVGMSQLFGEVGVAKKAPPKNVKKKR
jgi:hypothetical protein